MLRLSLAPRQALVALIVGVVLLAVAAVVCAEEALVLDNGAILRGTVLREDGHEVVLQLAGVGTDSRVTIERSRIVQRFMTIEPRRVTSPVVAEPTPIVPLAPRSVEAPIVATPTPAVPYEDPHPWDESFFARIARRAGAALPADAGSRAFLLLLVVVVVLALVALAGRMVDIEGLTLGRATSLAVLFVGLVALDVQWYGSTLRSNQAALVVPLELLAWMGCAAGLLRCGLGRAFNLLAFVLVSSALVAFSVGVVLVSV